MTTQSSLFHTSPFLRTLSAPLVTDANLATPQFFNAWDLNNPATGVIPHSPPNVIVTGTAPEEENGTASLTVLYPGSKVNSFDLHYFWFGCALDTVEGTVTTAIGCEINVAGFRNNKEVASATFDFVPTAGELTATPMIQAKLPNTFKDLQNITFAAPNPSMQIINADDFSVTTYT